MSSFPSFIQSNTENKSQYSLDYNPFIYYKLNSSIDKYYNETFIFPQSEIINTEDFNNTELENSDSITDNFCNPQVDNNCNNKNKKNLSESCHNQESNLEKCTIKHNPPLSANLLNKEEHNIKVIIDNNNYNSNNDKENFVNNNSNKMTKKRGRTKINVNSKRIHDKFSKDNILRKLQIHYLKFLTNFANLLIKQILFEDKDTKVMQFNSLKHKFFKNINKKAINSFKKRSLGDILKCIDCPECKSAKNNIEVYNKITNKSIIIKNIIDKPYLEFFDMYYYGKKQIFLSKYGINQYIILSNDIQLFQDLIKINKTNSIIDDEKYREKIEKIIKEEFFQASKNLFKCLKK